LFRGDFFSGMNLQTSLSQLEYWNEDSGILRRGQM
jgi:hypothetical protein